MWAIYGNSLADTAAGQALARIPDLCKEWIEDSKTRHVNEQEALKITWSYLAQLNLERQKLLKNKNSTTEYVRGGQAAGDDAWAILHDVYRVPTTCMTQDALQIERAQANLQGTNFAFRLGMAADPGVARSLGTLTGTFRLGHLVAGTPIIF